MKHAFIILTVGAAILLTTTVVIAGTAEILASISTQIDNSSNASPEMKTLAKNKLLPLCTNELFVKSVKAQNAKGMTLDEIRKIDETWQAAEDFLPIHEKLLSNDCAAEIKRIAKKITELTEIFVMDNQGANVGQNTITSDYWQGDEPKWQNSYNDGKGGVEVGKAKLDKSINRIDQKISLPIIDNSGKVIGAICIGVSL